MTTIAQVFLVFVAIQHVLFLVLEMFLWKTPIGLKVFRMTPAVAETTAALAANQGLYNGFLAAGLLWAFLAQNVAAALFFFSCVVVAGVFGGLTVSHRIMVIQAVPALLGLLSLKFFCVS